MEVRRTLGAPPETNVERGHRRSRRRARGSVSLGPWNRAVLGAAPCRRAKQARAQFCSRQNCLVADKTNLTGSNLDRRRRPVGRGPGVSRTKGEGPVDARPGERACHGRQAPGFRAKQDSESEERSESKYLAYPGETGLIHRRVSDTISFLPRVTTQQGLHRLLGRTILV